MASVPARTDLDFTASAQEGQLNCPNVRFHVDPQAALGSHDGVQITAVFPLVTPSRDDRTDAEAMRTMPLNGSHSIAGGIKSTHGPWSVRPRLVPRFDLDHVAQDVIGYSVARNSRTPRY